MGWIGSNYFEGRSEPLPPRPRSLTLLNTEIPAVVVFDDLAESEMERLTYYVVTSTWYVSTDMTRGCGH